MHKLRTHALFLWVLLSRVSGQPDPYDNDYSGIKNFQEFAYLAPVATPSSNLGIAAAGVFGLVIGHFSPLRGGASKKSSAQLEQLYKIVSAKNVEIQKLKTMVYEFEYRNQELKQALFESEQESLKRDYEEFKQPDANGDDVISRNEVSLETFIAKGPPFTLSTPVLNVHSKLHESLSSYSAGRLPYVRGFRHES